MKNELFEEYPDIVDIKQMMKMLGIGRMLEYKILKSGEVDYRKVGRDYRISKQSIQNYFNQGKQK